MNRAQKAAAAAMVFGIIFSLSPWSSSALALAGGVFVSLVFGNPWISRTKVYAQKLLTYSVVGLGAGMNLIEVGKAGAEGFAYTAISISLTLSFGLFLGKLLKSDRDTSILISVGTAICGGSAIAAISPVLRAKSHSITVALGTVFLLNGIALMIFPPIGHFFQLSQRQFGLWSALAIHDTSSVVGAGLQYGAEALQLGTIVKLTRALWIVPLTFGFGFFLKPVDGAETAKAKKPWFILGFLLVSAFFTWMPNISEYGHFIELAARKGLSLTLFLIGANLSRETLKSVGLRPFLQGFVLWSVVSLTTLIFLKNQ